MGKRIKHFISKQKKEEILDRICSFLQQQDEIYAAYLFGSFFTRESFTDIDLGVLLRQESEDPLGYELELESKIEKLERFRLDVRVLNRAPLSFVQNIIRHGRVIIDREPKLRSDFESYVLKKYFDFSRFRRMYLTEVINAPI